MDSTNVLMPTNPSAQLCPMQDVASGTDSIHRSVLSPIDPYFLSTAATGVAMDPVAVPDSGASPSADPLPISAMPSSTRITAHVAPTLAPFPPDVAGSAAVPPAPIIVANLSPGSSASGGLLAPHHLVATPSVFGTADPSLPLQQIGAHQRHLALTLS
jgi:hypothetical protein